VTLPSETRVIVNPAGDGSGICRRYHPILGAWSVFRINNLAVALDRRK
jgi:hypothetical protein